MAVWIFGIATRLGVQCCFLVCFGGLLVVGESASFWAWRGVCDTSGISVCLMRVGLVWCVAPLRILPSEILLSYG